MLVLISGPEQTVEPVQAALEQIGATVVHVDSSADGGSGVGVDDKGARSSMLRVLAHALRAEEAPRRLRVRVLDHTSGPDVVARCAAGEDVVMTSPSGLPAGDSDVDMSYTDWRTEVLGLAQVEF